MTNTETPEQVSTELTNRPAKKPAGIGLTNPQVSFWRAWVLETDGTDQALTQAVPSSGRKHIIVIDARDHRDFPSGFVSLPLPVPGHPSFRLSHVAQESPLDCCPVCSSSPSPGCPVSHLPDTCSQFTPDEQRAVDWRGGAVPFQCSS